MIYGKGLRKTMKGEGGPDPGARTRGSGGMGGVLHSRMLAPGARGPDHGPGPGPGAVARRGDQFINVKVSGALDPRPRAQGPGPRPKPLSGSRAQFRVQSWGQKGKEGRGWRKGGSIGGRRRGSLEGVAEERGEEGGGWGECEETHRMAHHLVQGKFEIFSTQFPGLGPRAGPQAGPGRGPRPGPGPGSGPGPGFRPGTRPQAGPSNWHGCQLFVGVTRIVGPVPWGPGSWFWPGARTRPGARAQGPAMGPGPNA